MNIGCIGTGQVSQKLSKLLTQTEHSVRLGSRNPTERKVELPGTEVEIGTYQEVAEWAEMVILGIPYGAVAEVVSPLQERLAGKVVVDATNPIHADWSPRWLGEQNSAGEETARLLPVSPVVKAFNTIFADMMEPEKIASVPGGIAGFYCGDYSTANQTVGKLMRAIGFHPIEVGGMMCARYLEAMAHLNIQLAVGMQRGTQAAFVYAG